MEKHNFFMIPKILDKPVKFVVGARGTGRSYYEGQKCGINFNSDAQGEKIRNCQTGTSENYEGNLL